VPPTGGAHLHALADGAVVGVLVHQEVAEAAGQQRAKEAADLHAGHAHGGRASVSDALGLSPPMRKGEFRRQTAKPSSALATVSPQDTFKRLKWVQRQQSRNAFKWCSCTGADRSAVCSASTHLHQVEDEPGGDALTDDVDAEVRECHAPDVRVLEHVLDEQLEQARLLALSLGRRPLLRSAVNTSVMSMPLALPTAAPLG